MIQKIVADFLITPKQYLQMQSFNEWYITSLDINPLGMVWEYCGELGVEVLLWPIVEDMPD